LSIYADTSFLVSLYALDADSERAAAQIQKAKLPILLTAFGELELANAISLRLFRRELASSTVKAARMLVQQDVVNGVLLISPLTTGIFVRATRIARQRTPQLGTGTLDILHVASALELRAGVFCTFDHKQEKLARIEGLTVV
jgi:predicted nucleic acid-binding protein